MKNTVRSIGAAALIAGALLATSACSAGNSTAGSTAPAASTVATASSTAAALPQATAKDISGAIKGFFATATSSQIGAAFPDHATDETFAPVLAKIDPSAPSAPVKKAVTDLALLKVSDTKAALAVAVDESKVKINGAAASVPASAISVTSNGKKVSNSAVLAADINSLVYRDGAWEITFPGAAAASPSASATASK